VKTAPLGWLTSSPQAALAFLPPEPLSGPEAARSRLFAAFAGGADPARRIVVVRASFDVRIRLDRRPGRAPRFERVAEGSRLTQAGFDGLVSAIQPSAQRDPAVPACQLSLNLHLVSDVPCRVQLSAPFLWPGFRAWPGPLVAGRFPLENWPRPLNAILEWQDPGRDWVLRRGDPLAYCAILYDDPDTVPRLVEAARTPVLARHIERLNLVTEVARNVAPMFEAAAAARPPRLLVPKRGGEDHGPASRSRTGP
jgi:hypothetical protein